MKQSCSECAELYDIQQMAVDFRVTFPPLCCWILLYSKRVFTRKSAQQQFKMPLTNSAESQNVVRQIGLAFRHWEPMTKVTSKKTAGSSAREIIIIIMSIKSIWLFDQFNRRCDAVRCTLPWLHAGNKQTPKCRSHFARWRMESRDQKCHPT